MRGNGELISSNRFINWRANCHVNKQGARSKAPFTHGGVERINQRERVSSSSFFFFCQPESANPHFYAILRVFIFSINTQIMTRALFNPLRSVRFIPPLSYGTDGQTIQDQMAWSVDSPGSKIYTFKKLWTASFCQPVFFFFLSPPLSSCLAHSALRSSSSSSSHSEPFSLPPVYCAYFPLLKKKERKERRILRRVF